MIDLEHGKAWVFQINRLKFFFSLFYFFECNKIELKYQFTQEILKIKEYLNLIGWFLYMWKIHKKGKKKVPKQAFLNFLSKSNY